MQFDVIIGNPPYQMNDGGYGRSASPIYHQFIEQAKKLNPKYVVMIIPARWFAGGKGLDEFRATMLADKRIKKLVDYWDATDCFPSVDIAGGVCYFLWQRDYHGDCKIINVYRNQRLSSTRPLNEFPTLVRFDTAATVIRKTKQLNERSLADHVSSRKPFGLATNQRPLNSGDLTLVWNGGSGLYDSARITTGRAMIKQWKVMTSKASYDHGGQPDQDGKRRVFSKIAILPPQTICTETYIIVGAFETQLECVHLVRYLTTQFVRFLVAQLSFSQDITKERFLFVPIQDFSESWTDDKLYHKYGLTTDEIAFIEAMIRPMDSANYELTADEN